MEVTKYEELVQKNPQHEPGLWNRKQRNVIGSGRSGVFTRSVVGN